MHETATLATIDSTDEIVALCELMRSYGRSVKANAQLIHIGLVKDAEGHIEKWDDGTPFDASLGSFSHWAKGEPDGRAPSWYRNKAKKTSKSSKKSTSVKYIAIDCRAGGAWMTYPPTKPVRVQHAKVANGW